MAVVVVDEAEGVVIKFAGEAPGVEFDEVAVGDLGVPGGAGHRAEGRVVVVGGDAVDVGPVEDVADVLVAVAGVEEVGAPVGHLHVEGARGDGFRRVPDEELVDGAVGAEALDAGVAVVDEALMFDGRAAHHLLAFHAPPQAVVDHRDDGVALRPRDGAVLGVVSHRPVARGGAHEGLVAVEVVGRLEGVDGDILVEGVAPVDMPLGDGAVADVVVGVGVALPGDQFVAHVVGIRLRLGRRHHGTRPPNNAVKTTAQNRNLFQIINSRIIARPTTHPNAKNKTTTKSTWHKLRFVKIRQTKRRNSQNATTRETV